MHVCCSGTFVRDRTWNIPKVTLIAIQLDPQGAFHSQKKRSKSYHDFRMQCDKDQPTYF